MDDKLNFKLLNLLILIAIICLLYLIRGLWLGLVGTVFSVIAPFLLAFGVAYMVYPLVRKLLKMGCAKWVAILITCVLSLGIVILLAITTIPLLYEQILLFISNISVFLSDLSVKYEINLGFYRLFFFWHILFSLCCSLVLIDPWVVSGGMNHGEVGIH